MIQTNFRFFILLNLLFFLLFCINCGEGTEDSSTGTVVEGSIDGQIIDSVGADFATAIIQISDVVGDMVIIVSTGFNEQESEETYFDAQILLEVSGLEVTEGTPFLLGADDIQLTIDQANDGDFESEDLNVESGTITFSDFDFCSMNTCHNAGTFELILEGSRGTFSGQFDANEVTYYMASRLMMQACLKN